MIDQTNARDFTAFENCFKFLCKNPRTECALLAMLEICLFQLRFHVMVIPRYLQELALVIGQALRKITGEWLFVTLRCSHLDRLTSFGPTVIILPDLLVVSAHHHYTLVHMWYTITVVHNIHSGGQHIYDTETFGLLEGQVASTMILVLILSST